MGLKYPSSYKKWTSTQKSAMLKKLQGYGFSTGGVINGVIPLDPETIYGEFISRSKDTGVIFAKPGESVMTEKFTNLLQPSVNVMEQFTKLANPNNVLPNSQTSTGDISFTSQISVNVDRLDSDMDVKALSKQLSKYMFADFTKYMTKDLRKLTGKNR